MQKYETLLNLTRAVTEYSLAKPASIQARTSPQSLVIQATLLLHDSYPLAKAQSPVSFCKATDARGLQSRRVDCKEAETHTEPPRTRLSLFAKKSDTHALDGF